jgi:hypothetical protein
MKIFIWSAAIMLITACGTIKPEVQAQSKASKVKTQAPKIIYQIRRKYIRYVPVGLDSARAKIVSFPHPADLKVNGELQTPLPLIDGFWFDRRGITPNSGFVKMTYANYAALPSAPSMAVLDSLLFREQPFMEMYSCPDIPNQPDTVLLNKVVRGGFKNCIEIFDIQDEY